MKVRETSKPLGLKINQVMAEKGIAGDYAALAREFKVKTPSVYDWIDHERLGKAQYRRLVEWSGRSLDWWFDIGVEAATANVRRLQEPQPPAYVAPRPWPFSRSYADYCALSDLDKGRLDGYFCGLVDTASSGTAGAGERLGNGAGT